MWYPIPPGRAQRSPPWMLAVVIGFGVLSAIVLWWMHSLSDPAPHEHAKLPVSGPPGQQTSAAPACPALLRPASVDRHGDPLPPGAIRRFGTLRLRHRRAVTAIDLSPDGREILAASEDGALIAWDFATGSELRHRASWGTVTAIERLPGGAGLATSGGLDAVFILRDAATAAPRLRLVGPRPPKPNSSTVHPFAASPDGRLWATAGAGNDVRLWEASTGRPGIVLQEGAAPAAALAFPDALRLAALARTGEWTLWETAGAKVKTARLFEGKDDTFASASPDGRFFAAAGNVWDAATGKAVSRLRGGKRRYRFSADGRRVASVGTEILVLDAATGAVVFQCPVPGGGYGTAVALSADGSTVVCGTYDGALSRLRVEAGPEIPSLDAPEGEISALAFTGGGARLVAALPREIRAFDVESGDVSWRLPLDHDPGTLAALPGNEIAVVCNGWTLVYDAATGDSSRAFATPAAPSPRPVITSDGRFLAFAIHGGNTPVFGQIDGLEVWNLQDGTVRARIPAPEGKLESLALSADGAILAGTVEHHTLILWDAATGEERGRAAIPTRFTYRSVALPTPRGGLALFSGCYSARFMTVGGVRVGLADTNPAFPGQNHYSPDGLLFAFPAWNDNTRLVVSGLAPNPIPLRLPNARLTSLAWAPDGRVLATGTADGAVHLWDVRHPDLLKTDPTTPPVPPAEQKTDGPPVLRLDFDDGFQGPGLLDTRISALDGGLKLVEGVRGSALRVEAGPDSRPLAFPEAEAAGVPGPWTVEFWFRIEEGAPWEQKTPEAIAEFYFLQILRSDLFSFDVRQAMQPHLFYNSCNIYGEVGGHGSFDLNVPRGPIPAGRWTHVALAFEPQDLTLALYLDGTHASTTHHSSLSPPRVGPLTIGSGSMKPPIRAATLDELQVFDYARTAKQVASDAAKR